MPRFIARWIVPPGTPPADLASGPPRVAALERAHYWSLSDGQLFAVYDASDETSLRAALAARPPVELHRIELEYDRVTSEMRRP